MTMGSQPDAVTGQLELTNQEKMKFIAEAVASISTGVLSVVTGIMAIHTLTRKRGPNGRPGQ